YLFTVYDSHTDLRGCEHICFYCPAFYHPQVLPALRRTRLRARGEIHTFPAVCDGRSRGLGRRGGGIAGLRDRDGFGGHCGERPHSYPAFTDAYVRSADAILFHPSRIIRFDSCSNRRTTRLRNSFRLEDDIEDCGLASACKGVKVPPRGGLFF